jgi:NADH-quinone oxidoreductase subunit J
MFAQLLFFFFAAVAVAAALGMLVARSPVTSALWLVLNLFCIAGLYVTLNAEFLGVIQVLVYAGAIMVLFLFVIMLLNVGALPAMEQFDWKSALAFLLGMGVLAQLMYVVARSAGVLPEPITGAQAADAGSVNQIARLLFTRYALGLEVIGILLLAATVGAVMLAQRRFE